MSLKIFVVDNKKDYNTIQPTFCIEEGAGIVMNEIMKTWEWRNKCGIKIVFCGKHPEMVRLMEMVLALRNVEEAARYVWFEPFNELALFKEDKND
jgi:hypothetical protein